MTLYQDIYSRLLTRREFFSFLVDTGLYPRFIEAAATLSRYYTEYKADNIDYVMKNLPQLDIVRSTIIEIYAPYLSFIGIKEGKVKDFISLINDYIAILMNHLQYNYELLITKARGEKAQYAAMHRIMYYIGELLEFYKMIFLHDPQTVVNYVAMKHQLIQNQIKHLVSLGKKLRQIEESFVVEEPIEIVEEAPQEQEQNIEISKELHGVTKNKLVESAEKVEGTKKRGLFSPQELKLLLYLMKKLAFTRKRTAYYRDIMAELGFKSKKELADTALLINSKIKQAGEKEGIDTTKHFQALIFIPDLDNNFYFLHPGVFKYYEKVIRKNHPKLVEVFYHYYDIAKERGLISDVDEMSPLELEKRRKEGEK